MRYTLRVGCGHSSPRDANMGIFPPDSTAFWDTQPLSIGSSVDWFPLHSGHCIGIQVICYLSIFESCQIPFCTHYLYLAKIEFLRLENVAGSVSSGRDDG